MFIYNTRAYYLFMLSMIESQSVLHFVSKQMFTFKTRMFYRTTVLYMLDSWCKMHHLYSILFTSLGPISFLFVYGLLFPKVKIISFYQFHVLYNNFGDMNTVCQLCCFKSVSLRHTFVCFSFQWVFVCLCVCLCIYCCVCMNSVSMYL